MTQRFKLIATLITLSLVGIIVIQVSWIRNSVSLQKEQFSENVKAALYDVSEEIHIRKDSLADNANPIISRMYSSFLSVENIMNNDQIKMLIADNLERHSVYSDKFEYCVKNKFGQSTLYSPNFSYENLEQSYVQELSQDMFNTEELYVYINQSNSDILRSVSWLLISALLFTAIILGTFYVTLGTLLNQRKLSELKTNFINNMTHEFKTPLATVSLAVDALSNPKVTEQPQMIDYYKNIIKEENKRMNDHVENILQAAKIDKNSLRLKLEEVDINQILEEVVSKFKLQIETIGGEIEIQENAKKHILLGDEFHLTNVFSNLIDNAIKYRKEDTNLKVSIITSNPNPKTITIDIKDNGLGMSREVLSQVFDRFYRADTGNIHNVKGFGLGLAYSKEIIELHGGKIRAESALGQGSTFKVTLPLES